MMLSGVIPSIVKLLSDPSRDRQFNTPSAVTFCIGGPPRGASFLIKVKHYNCALIRLYHPATVIAEFSYRRL
uniref:Venom protein n=1 Tax=Ampulex compressa TaxID=860918 RepID=A0A1W6EWE1_AMPCP|nr:venom protein [Ampulex compressa]